jgi:hypothetical protein
MAKHSQAILDLARRGAKVRYEELKSELDSLVKHFPNLSNIMRKGGMASRASAALSRGRKAAMAAVSANERPPRKRRRMSARARKAISDAQKARWAKQKASGAAERTSAAHKAGKKR